MYCLFCAGPFLQSSDTPTQETTTEIYQTLKTTCDWLGNVVGIPVYPKIASLLPLTLTQRQESADHRIINWTIASPSLTEYAKVTPVRLDEKVTFTCQRTDLRVDIHIKPIAHIYGIVCHRQCYRLFKKLATPKDKTMLQTYMDVLFKAIWLWKQRDEFLNIMHNLSYSVNMQLRPATGFLFSMIQPAAASRSTVQPAGTSWSAVHPSSASQSREMKMLTDPMLVHSENGHRLRKLWRFFIEMKKTTETMISCLDPWMTAARSGNIQAMEKHRDYLNRYDEIGFTALHWAIDFKRWDVVKWLLRQPNFRIQHVRLLKPLLEDNGAHPMAIQVLKHLETASHSG